LNAASTLSWHERFLSHPMFTLQGWLNNCSCHPAMTALADPKRHILVVDDDALVCETVTMLLRSEGHLVATATSGAEALAVFEPGKFDLVFTDFLMPSMTGEKLATEIKNRCPGQPVVMLTGYPERLEQEERPLTAVDLLIGKPFEIESLREAIRRFAPVLNLEFTLLKLNPTA
jgi:CheY-like chemotaxis protein